MTDEMPRRCQLDKNTPAELAIRSAIGAIEELGADPRLTNIVIELSTALQHLHDWVDDQLGNGKA